MTWKKAPAPKGARERSQTNSPRKTTPRKKSVPPSKTATAIPKSSRSSDDERSFPIVAIGASAGGLEAFERFLKGVPSESGMAFIIVQHLDPSHKSILTELVKRVTPMDVQEVTDGMVVEPNSVYIIPPNSDLSIMHGTLQLIEPIEPRGLRLPIDYFFRAFSLDAAERSICIVLSGTGTDGTLGLKAIKEVGGMVMVQKPESAKYDGMPRSAIGTGLADIVLPPEEMGSQLMRYVGQAAGMRIRQLSKPLPYKEEELKKVYVLLRNQTGHDFSFYKPNTILRRIERNRSDPPPDTFFLHTM